MHDEKPSTTSLSCYSPPNSAPASARKKFYTQLDKLVTPRKWLFGYFNARVGRRISSSDTKFGGMPSNTLGHWSLKDEITPNDNGFSLLQSETKKNLRHVDSHFYIRNSKRWTWRHPLYNTRTVLDHVLLPAPQLRMWKLRQKSGKRITRSMQEEYRELCRQTKMP